VGRRRGRRGRGRGQGACLVRRFVRRAQWDNDYLFTFSPTGVESFYALPEDAASTGLADYLMLRRKLPDEVFAGRRLLPSALFRRDDVTSYLAHLDRTLDATEDELGEEGSIDVFALTRRLGHRMGLASWAGDAFERLVRAFDVFDGSDAFVHPDAMAAVTASDKRAERAALDDVTEVIENSVLRVDRAGRHDAQLVVQPEDHIVNMGERGGLRGWLVSGVVRHGGRLPDAVRVLGRCILAR
jgi:hypothetical protein